MAFGSACFVGGKCKVLKNSPLQGWTCCWCRLHPWLNSTVHKHWVMVTEQMVEVSRCQEWKTITVLNVRLSSGQYSTARTHVCAHLTLQLYLLCMYKFFKNINTFMKQSPIVSRPERYESDLVTTTSHHVHNLQYIYKWPCSQECALMFPAFLWCIWIGRVLLHLVFFDYV